MLRKIITQAIAILIALSILNLGLVSASENPMKRPWGRDSGEDRLAGLQSKSASLPASIMLKAIELFQKFISPVDGPRSRHLPTSSEFGRRAVAKHGAVLGFLLIVDRLIHEFYPSKASPTIFSQGAPRFYDPLEANDFGFASGYRNAEGDW